MNLRWLMTVLSICVFGTSFSAAIAVRNEYIAVKGHSSKYRQSYFDERNEDELNTSIQITEMRVRSEISLRYATTSVITQVHNPGRWSQEYDFSMLLPETAFITGFTMILDGKSYKAYVKEKEEAKVIYDAAVTQGVGAAHVATEVRDSNHFKVSVNVEGNSTAVFDLRYEEFLVRRNKMYNHVINLYPGTFVPKMEVVVHIKESKKITKLRVPELRTGREVDATENDRQYSKAVIRKGKTRREVTVTFRPDLREQERLAEIYTDKTKDKSRLNKHFGFKSDEEEDDEDKKEFGQFVVQYDVSRYKNEEILVNDGYFVHFLAPTALPPLSKQVVFVLDTSISMIERKIEQLRNAMETILSDLNPKDYFSIVEFNTFVKVHDLREADTPSTIYDYAFNDDDTDTQNQHSMTIPQSALATPQNIAKAKVIISRLEPTGGTNINEALNMALTIISKGVSETYIADPRKKKLDSNSNVTIYNNGINKKDVELEPVIIFLTDGNPNVGVTITDRIISSITDRNAVDKRASLYSLAFGEDADRNFLRRLSLRNEGFMRHIYEDSDAALQLHDFYRQVSSPLLSHVQFLYPSRQVKPESVSRNEFRTIHEGSEVAVVGQITEDATEIAPQVFGYRSADDGIGRKNYELSSSVSVNRTNGEYLPLERLWAYLTIKQLLEKVVAEDYDRGYEDSPQKKALDIALKYGFVTPLTSLVVVKLNETKSMDTATVRDAPMHVAHTAEMFVMPPPAQPIGSSARSGVVGDNLIRLDYKRDLDTIVLIRSQKTGRNQGRPGISGTQSLLKPQDIQTYGQSITEYNTIGENPSSGGLPGPVYRSSGEKGDSGSLGLVYRPPENQVDEQRVLPFTRGKGETVYFNTNDTAQYPTTSLPDTSTSQVEVYHLEGFEWTSSILESSSDSLVFAENGTQVILKLAKTFNPPKAHGGDSECFNSTSLNTTAVVGVNELTGSVCVYVTRCFAARAITADDYKKSYCFVNDRYAGVCCPRSEVKNN